MTAVAQGAALGQKLIGPIIEERLKHLNGDGDEKAASEKPVCSSLFFPRIVGAQQYPY